MVWWDFVHRYLHVAQCISGHPNAFSLSSVRARTASDGVPIVDLAIGSVVALLNALLYAFNDPLKPLP